MLLAISSLISVSAAAQNSRGSLTGTVNDSSGGRVVSAKVAVKAVDSSLERTTTTNNRGEFRLDDLLPGAYTVTVNASGLAEVKSDVTIAVSSVKDINVA